MFGLSPYLIGGIALAFVALLGVAGVEHYRANAAQVSADAARIEATRQAVLAQSLRDQQKIADQAASDRIAAAETARADAETAMRNIANAAPTQTCVDVPAVRALVDGLFHREPAAPAGTGIRPDPGGTAVVPPGAGRTR